MASHGIVTLLLVCPARGEGHGKRALLPAIGPPLPRGKRRGAQSHCALLGALLHRPGPVSLRPLSSEPGGLICVACTPPVSPVWLLTVFREAGGAARECMAGSTLNVRRHRGRKKQRLHSGTTERGSCMCQCAGAAQKISLQPGWWSGRAASPASWRRPGLCHWQPDCEGEKCHHSHSISKSREKRKLCNI